MHNYQFNKLAAVVIPCSKLCCLSFSSLFVLSGVPSWLLSATPTRTHCLEEGVSPDGGDSTDSGGGGGGGGESVYRSYHHHLLPHGKLAVVLDSSGVDITIVPPTYATTISGETNMGCGYVQ